MPSYNNFHRRNDGTKICGVLERDLTLLFCLGISMNDNLSQKVYTANWLPFLSEGTVWFLTVTKSLIGDQHKYSLLAGLQLMKFQ